jgi:hypothetical protein
MKYLEKNSTYKDKKKNVGARVSEVVLSALNNAEQDSNDLGYTFSITRIIDKALQDTLVELVEETGMDYLVLEQFKYEMNERQEIRNIKSEDSNWIDFEKKVHEIKLRALNDSSIDMKFLLEEEEKKTTDHWDNYVINRKENKVRDELEKLTEDNQRLEQRLKHMDAKEAHDYYHGIDYERDMAFNDGIGDIWSEGMANADKAFQETFDAHMKKNEKAIQKRYDANNKESRTRMKKYLSKKYPEKTHAEIDEIINTPALLLHEETEWARQDLLDS